MDSMAAAREILLVLIAVAIASAEVSQPPQLASYASSVVREEGTVSASPGELKDLEVNISIPIDSSYQRTSLQSGELAIYDGNGNPFINIQEDNPSTPFTYSKTIVVETTARTTPSLPTRYAIPADYYQYISPTARTQSDDESIRSLAEQITENSTSQFEKAALLAIFVNNHLTYNEWLAGQENDALWTLQNKQGVCVEYSTLFAALARSIRIPTRYVTGYSYSEKHSTWLGHAWNEVYLGEWVPVDSTWMEIGFIDALHIESAKRQELQKDPPLVAHVTSQSSKLSWDREGRSGATANNIRTQSVDYAQPRTDYAIEAEQKTIPPGWKTVVRLSVKGSDYRVVPVTLASCRGEISLSVGQEEKFLILSPGVESTVSWEVSSPEYFPRNYASITCPLTLNSAYLGNKVVEIKVQPGLPKLPPIPKGLNLNTGGEGQDFTWEQPKPLPEPSVPPATMPEEASQEPELPFPQQSCPLAIALIAPMLLIAIAKR